MSAYVSIRQNTSAYVRQIATAPQRAAGRRTGRSGQLKASHNSSLRQHTPVAEGLIHHLLLSGRGEGGGQGAVVEEPRVDELEVAFWLGVFGFCSTHARALRD
jgi:hypothetical protein